MKLVDSTFDILRTDYGNIFFFILPFINLNWYYKGTNHSYGIISIGWLIFHYKVYIKPKSFDKEYEF